MFEKTFDAHKINRAVLCGLNSPVLNREQNADENSLEELEALLETAGGVCVGTVLQNKDKPDPKYFLGEGKVGEIRTLVEGTGADLVVVDNDLTPSQQRVLTETLNVQVLDRSALILDIVAPRSRTSGAGSRWNWPSTNTFCPG